VRSYWAFLGRRLWLSQPGRLLFTAALLVGVAQIAFVRAHGDREGAAPLVVLALLLAGVVALDAVARGGAAAALRLLPRHCCRRRPQSRDRCLPGPARSFRPSSRYARRERTRWARRPGRRAG